MENKEEIKIFFKRATCMAILLYLIFGVFFGVSAMQSNMMVPRISAGDLMLYYRLEKKLLSGDIVVFEKDNQKYTGRIVAVGNESVDITEDDKLKINDNLVIEQYIYYPTYRFDGGVDFPIVLKENQFFILGDYREVAKDSRYFGPINQAEIKGKVISVIRRSGL